MCPFTEYRTIINIASCICVCFYLWFIANIMLVVKRRKIVTYAWLRGLLYKLQIVLAFTSLHKHAHVALAFAMYLFIKKNTNAIFL